MKPYRSQTPRLWGLKHSNTTAVTHHRPIRVPNTSGHSARSLCEDTNSVMLSALWLSGAEPNEDLNRRLNSTPFPYPSGPKPQVGGEAHT